MTLELFAPAAAYSAPKGTGPAAAPRRRAAAATLRTILRGAALPALGLALWWAAYRFRWTDSQLFVPLSQVWETGLRLSANGVLWEALGASLRRQTSGFLLGSTAGLVFGTALGLSRWFDRLVGPSFHTIKQVSLLAWIPLISVWFGLGDAAKVAFLSLAAFFPVVLNTFEGIRSVPRELTEVARVFAFSRWQLIRRVVLPGALPSIFTGIYLALLYSWLATLGAEYLLTSGQGIGNLLVDGREHFWMDQVLLGVVVVGAVGFLLNLGAAAMESRLLRWRGPART
ncbi:ABC transporter permease [Aquabacterium sp. A7-Y]|uniref:ABC transporter permease n=1 Tax=Aquabacterium sp. A7-Y TaxID=1349605 RepID=UPI00223E1EE8|nr:ABC transporter permease [Aquabacterium sp. A7-Y]MCW7540171.1 ABC transporter permease [Aquabacterium sp. A7-Y]